jgi:hypothetical protein
LKLKPLVVTDYDVREDFELACIREFSHSGFHIGIGVSREERRERIRAAILRENKADRRWRNSDFTYAQMYARVYRQSLGDGGVHDLGSVPPGSRYGGWAIDEDFVDDEEACEEDDGISP